MKKIVTILSLLSIPFTAVSGDCAKSGVKDAQIKYLINAKFGDGVSDFCRWNRNLGGSGSFDRLFARVDCKNAGSQISFYVVGNDSGGILSNENCVISLEDTDSNFIPNTDIDRPVIKYGHGNMSVGGKNGDAKLTTRQEQQDQDIYCILVKNEPTCIDVSNPK
ncbi:MAG: hypothetical protein SGJ18_08685 [Pseudomonadota bacterium]|nr:hypothetical protein [Pseudomonadota bacterium]